MLLFYLKFQKIKRKENFSKMFIYRRLRLAVFCLLWNKKISNWPTLMSVAKLQNKWFVWKIDSLTSTNSFTKCLVANFVDVNKIRVCISILQKQAFWTIRNRNHNPILQKSVFLKNRKRKSWCIIVKNVILSIIVQFII